MIPTAKMEEILRQKTEGLKNAVQAIAIEGDPEKAIHILDKMDGIKQIEDQKERLMTIARDYLALSPKEMKKTLILTARNAERLQINLHIRDGLKEKGLINPASEKNYTMAIPQSIKEEDRRRGESYSQGDLVRFGRASQRLEVARGERGIIKEIDNNKLTVQMEKSDKAVIVDLGKYNKLERYSLEPRQFAPGDQVTFLKNDRDLGVVNSSVGTVKELINDNVLKVETRTGIKEVDLAKYNYIDHSYGSTFHKSQGMTSERVMIHIDTDQRLSNSANGFYVGLSRASHEATIYTNSREKLPESVSQWQIKESAQDFEKTKHLDFENGNDQNQGNHKEVDHSVQRGLGF
jgi:ATP-dependent exoDNAse (exonuclease V) alpha subunit